MLTGGSGFLGTALLQNSLFKDALVVGRAPPRNVVKFSQVNLDRFFDLTCALQEIDVVVHAAARVHVMNEKSSDALSSYRVINTSATLNLAHQAMRAGVKRFIYISTLKVLGDQTPEGRAFTAKDAFNPQDPYSMSKAEAEIGLKKIMESSDMEVVIIRPPLVYGKGVKGNIASLLSLVSLSLPTPLGAIQNKRSMISIDNLVDFISVCVRHPDARNQTFLVSDDHDISTSELYCLLAETGGYKPFIFWFPKSVLQLMLSTIGKKQVYDRLFQSLRVDMEFTKSHLNWAPPFEVKQSIAKCWLS